MIPYFLSRLVEPVDQPQADSPIEGSVGPSESPPARDLYEPVRSAFPETVESLQLNDGQREVVRAAANCPGGLLLVQGPPGTGKSHLMVQMARPYWQSRLVAPLLSIAPTNVAVNTLAKKYHKALQEDISLGKAEGGRYILQIHPERAENSIPGRELFSDHLDESSGHPSTQKKIPDLEDLETYLNILHRQSEAQVQRSFRSIEDPHVTLPEHSVARMMLEISGYTPSPYRNCDATAEVYFQDFRIYIDCIVRGVEIDKEGFEKSYQFVWDYTVKHAAVIITTAAQGGFRQILDTIATSVRIIFVDEATYTQEDVFLPFFTTGLTKCLGFVLLGDPQLKPAGVPTTETNLFAKQMETSFMARVIANGHPSHMLTDQHRMVPDILAIANDLTYRGRFSTLNQVSINRRPVAQAFQKWAKKMIRVPANEIIVNIPPCPANETKLSASESRYNDLFIIIEINWLRQLLGVHPSATIAMLTPYNAQKQRLVTAISEMTRNGIAGLERVTVSTFDSAIGEEWDFVIIDVLVPQTKSSLGFQADKSRMDIALTRARNGIIIFMDVDAVSSCKRANTTYMIRLNELMRNHKFKEKPHMHLPHCDFYPPKQA